MINIKRLEKSYKEFRLSIQDLDISDRVTIVLGDNGAGKTTLFRAILNLISTDVSDIKINDIENLKSDWKKDVATFIDEDYLIQFLTPKEMLQFFCTAYNLNQHVIQNKLDVHINFANDLFETKKPIKNLSKGNKQKVGIIMSFLCANKLVIWDEPFVHLDPTSQLQLTEIIKQSTEKKFLISSHYTQHIEEYGNRIIILKNGLITENVTENQKTNWNNIINNNFNQ